MATGDGLDHRIDQGGLCGERCGDGDRHNPAAGLPPVCDGPPDPGVEVAVGRHVARHQHDLGVVGGRVERRVQQRLRAVEETPVHGYAQTRGHLLGELVDRVVASVVGDRPGTGSTCRVMTAAGTQ
ncbi:hypothetical protein ACIBPB_32750 [Micromonospora sp. NPDC049836]|uniref:hypothetical protein n=1 Tax=Micromonospora sp. NPDC049836 TaxID=3364274 RepID=UPI0037BB0CB4